MPTLLFAIIIISDAFFSIRLETIKRTYSKVEMYASVTSLMHKNNHRSAE